MQAIVTHKSADFDALASAVAAKKLWPEAVLAFAGGLERNVREFVALHSGNLPPLETSPLPHPERFHTIIVVDTNQVERLGDLQDRVQAEDVEVFLFDHHPDEEGSIVAEHSEDEAVGATVTLVARQLRRRRIRLTPFEATLMALGLYEDTGCFTFGNTTPADLETAAWLRARGANLDVVAAFISRALTPEQRKLLNELVQHTRYVNVHGVSLAVATAQSQGYVDEVAYLTHKLADLENVDAVFTLTESEGTVYVVGRSKSSAVAINSVLEPLGGGGHHRAGSARFEGAKVEEIEARLMEAVKERIRPLVVARDIMASPPYSVTPEATMGEAALQLMRHGVDALLVMDGEKLVGIIDQQDVEKARYHKLMRAPVKSFANRKVTTAPPEASLRVLERLMVHQDASRVPVVEKGKVLGVVTRGALLRALHGAAYVGEYPLPSAQPQQVPERSWRQLAPELLELIRQLGVLAQQKGVRLFLVGGFVRDLLLYEPNLDLDLLVEGDAIKFAHAVVERLGGKVAAHEKFMTAVVTLSDGLKLDFASARAEYYEKPAALPTVQVASVKEDLGRRDFTINAMAVSLNPPTFGELLDYYGGREDLASGVVRVLHSLSFVEDPTRIFRAIRFEQRLGFRMDPHTEQLIIHAQEEDLLGRLAGPRVKDELVQMLSEPNPVPAIHRMAHLDVLRFVDPALKFDEERLAELGAVANVTEKYEHEKGKLEGRWLVYLLPLLRGAAQGAALRMAARLGFSRRETKVVQQFEGALAALEALRKVKRPSEICKVLERFDLLVVLYLAARARSERKLQQKLWDYVLKWREAKPRLKGEELLALGLPESPKVGYVLERLREAVVDGEAPDKAAELELAKRLIKELT